MNTMGEDVTVTESHLRRVLATINAIVSRSPICALHVNQNQEHQMNIFGFAQARKWQSTWGIITKIDLSKPWRRLRG